VASRDGSDRPSDGVFVGRSRELDAVRRCVEEARAGRSQVVWIEGEPGTGKTTLLRRILAELDGSFAVLATEADELSMDAPFSLLSQFGPVEASGAFAAGLVLLERLGSMQRDGAVAVVAEDVHWADPASRGALLTVARRLRHDQVLLLLTSRPGSAFDDWERFVLDPERCLRVVLGGLDDGEVGELAARHGVTLTSSQAARLREHTSGHPLHARTLLAELTPEQLQAPSGELPAPRSLASATVATLAGLPPAAQALAAGLAVLGTRTPLAVAATVAGVDAPSEALEPLLASGLVRWSPGEERTPVEYTHPLLRTAVYVDLAPGRRRELHLRAAEVTRWGTSWAHRVAASDSVDDELADELEAGAQFEVDRQARSLAAMYLSWSATLTSSRPRAEERLLRGVRLLIIDGQTSRAAALYPRVEECAQTALRDLVIGMLAFAQADAPGAERWLRSVPERPGPSWVHAEAHGQLGLLYALQGRGAEGVREAEAALAERPFADPRIDHDAWWSLAINLASVAGAPAALDRLAERIAGPPALVDPDEAELLVLRGMLRDLAGHTHDGVADMRAGIELARRGATIRQLPRAHLSLSRALFNAGDWDEAQAHARVALSLMDEDRVWMGRQAEAALVPVLAARGELELAAEYVAAAAAAADEVRTVEIDNVARLARASLAAARGDWTGVIDAYGPLAADGVLRSVAPMTMLVWWPLLVRATIEVGDLEAATDQLEGFAATAAAARLDVTTHLAELGAALAAARRDPDAAAELYARAVASLGPDHPALARALLHHQYGRLLRARGARREARDQLRTAHELLTRLGAETYRQAVAEDLSEWTTRDDRQTKRSPLELTTREQDVVALVNKGFTNKEVGAQLYISAKAVEYHLGNVYGKLGVRSRRELRDVLATSGPGAERVTTDRR
jgi:DNA-binding NarL/FixJ family response regulator